MQRASCSGVRERGSTEALATEAFLATPVHRYTGNPGMLVYTAVQAKLTSDPCATFWFWARWGRVLGLGLDLGPAKDCKQAQQFRS